MQHLRQSLVALALATLVAVGASLPGMSAVAPVRAATAGPKVVIVVGATHGVTDRYRSYADTAYAEAIKHTPNVVKVYSPNATWSAVKAAAKGASILIYFGHGNGWPSPYTYDPNYTTKDGFGLNSSAGNGDHNNKYYGEPYVASLELADNAIVMLHHLCYASGNSEPGQAAPSVSTAKKRIDNYGAGFLKSKARAVLADGHRGPVDYLRAIFTTNQTIESLWRNAPNANGNVTSFAGTRSAGARAFMDPNTSTSGFYRSLIGDPGLTTREITGGFSVPGRAAPKADGAPLYSEIPTGIGTATTVEPTSLLPAATRLTILERAAGSGDSAIFRVQGLDDPSIEGFMAARDLDPRDSLAPYLLKVTGGSGGAYRANDAGRHALSGLLSESAEWTARISRGGTTHATASGTGTTASVSLDVAAAGGDGAYDYEIVATDGWSNGPSSMRGTFVIDSTAPTLVSVAPNADTVALVSPNGDLSREKASWSATSNEAGSIGVRVSDAGGGTVRTLRVSVGMSATTVAWNGRDASGVPVRDGLYEIHLTPRDAAGNDGPAVSRKVLVDTTLGDVDASKKLFYPQDRDRLSKTTTLRFKLTREATVTWTIVNSAGTVVRTLLDGVTLPAGPVTRAFDGRRADGTFLPRGTYRSVVTLAGDGPVAISQWRTFRMQAFKVSLSDSTPRRGQRITVYATTAESLSTRPRVYVYQPGKTRWSVAMTKVSKTKYRITLTLKTGGRTGTVRFRVAAADVDGRRQSTNLYVPLH